MRTDMMISRSGAALALLALVPLAASAQQTVERNIHVSSPFTLVVQNDFGAVRLTGAERGDVAVQGALAAGDSLAVERSDRWVRIRVVGPTGENRPPRRESRLVLRVPRGTAVEIQTRDGNAEVDGTGGLIRVRSEGGGITVRGASRTVTAETVSGSIDVSGSSQTVVATSATGAIHLAGVRGYLEVSTTDGEVVLSDCSPSQATITTVTGPVRFDGTIRPHGLARIDTYTGNVELKLPPDIDATFEVSSFAGDIVNDLGPAAHNTSRYAPGHELQFTLGDGSARIVVDTFGGAVRLTPGPTSAMAFPPNDPAGLADLRPNLESQPMKVWK